MNRYDRMEGYNPSVSLLPQGSGVITPMSGGGAPPGYDPSASLLPQGPGPIGLYKGGDPSASIQYGMITNTGRDGEFSNQCMLLSIIDHLKWKKNGDKKITLKSFRDDLSKIVDFNKNWLPTEEFNFGKQVCKDAITHISEKYKINIWIHVATNPSENEYKLTKYKLYEHNPTYNDIDIISLGYHFNLLILPDKKDAYDSTKFTSVTVKDLFDRTLQYATEVDVNVKNSINLLTVPALHDTLLQIDTQIELEKKN